MAFLIGEACVDVMDRSCIKVCPVECIGCAACEPECPVQAIYIDDDVPAEEQWHIADNADFFTNVLPGEQRPVGNPGGSRNTGPIGVDTPRISGLPVKDVT